MKITGYRVLETVHHWGRAVGDVNGVVPDASTPVPIILLETNTEHTGVGLGNTASIEQLFPALDGQDPRGVASLYDSMIAHCFKVGHQGAIFGTIGALDMALWDLAAKAAGLPLWRYLGGKSRFVPGYASGLDAGLSETELAALYTDFAQRGFTAAKVKITGDLAVDKQRLHLVREVLAHGTTPTLMIDANEAWHPKQAVATIQDLEQEFELAWVEEPVRRWDGPGLAQVSNQIRAGVATGENLTGLEQFAPLISGGGADIVQTGSVWGITHFVRVAHLAHAFSRPISPVAYHCNPLAAPALAIPNHLGIEVQNLHDPLGVESNQQIDDGGILLPDLPGSGIVIDEAQIHEAQTTAANSGWQHTGGPHVRPPRAGLRLNPRDPDPLP